MAADTRADRIQVGDRVVNLQVPGIFHVIARRGDLLEIETEQGLRLTVRDAAVRRVDDTQPPPPPKDD
jgi:hypothetical protein